MKSDFMNTLTHFFRANFERFLLLIALSLFVNSCNIGPSNTIPQFEKPEPTLVEGRLNAGFLIMNGVYNTELTAPFDIFQHTIYREGIEGMNVFTVANTLEPIRTFEGIHLLPDYDYTKEAPKIDILIVPSAEGHLEDDLKDTVMLNFVRETASNANYVISLCDGSFVLAKAGLLTHVKSTTFPGDLDTYEEMFPSQDVIRNTLVVHDGKFITSAGGAKSFEPSLYLVEHLWGKKAANGCAKGMVIDWDLNSLIESQKVIVIE